MTSVLPQTRGIERFVSTQSHEFSAQSIDHHPVQHTTQGRAAQGHPTLGATQ